MSTENWLCQFPRNDLVVLLDIALHYFMSRINWVNKTTNKKEIIKTVCDSLNHIRFPKEDHLPDWARLDNKVTKGDRVERDMILYFCEQCACKAHGLNRWGVFGQPTITSECVSSGILLYRLVSTQWRTQEFCSTHSVEDSGQRERGSGGGSPLVRGSGWSCSLVQEISFHTVKFS